MKFSHSAVLILLFLSPSCSLTQRLEEVSTAMNEQYASLEVWEKLPVRTITWNQALDMMAQNNIKIQELEQSIERAEREELSVYTDMIPGLSYYGYMTSAISDLAGSESIDSFRQNVNVTFNIPALTRIGYDVYASKAATFSAIKAREGKIRELGAALYLAIRRRALEKQLAELEQANPSSDAEQNEFRQRDADVKFWNEVSDLLGNRDARWEILPASVPQLRWEDYRGRLDKLDPLIVTQWALRLEQSRLRIYSVAMQLLPTINTSLYSPSLFSSTGGTYSGTFLDGDDTKLNLSISYSLDTQLRQWNTYKDGQAAYEKTKKQISFEMMDRKVKLAKLRRSVDEYETWRRYIHKRIDFLRSQQAVDGEGYEQRERQLREMRKELINQEISSLETEGALILEYGLPRS